MASHVPDISNDRLSLGGQSKPALVVALIFAVIGVILTVTMAATKAASQGDGHGSAHSEAKHDSHADESKKTEHSEGHGADGHGSEEHGAAGGHDSHGGGHAHHGYVDHEHPFWHSYVMNFAFFASIALGAIFFVILHHLVRSGWSVTVRRLAEGVAMNIFLIALFAIPFLFSDVRAALWVWESETVRQTDELVAAKAGYLNPTFFVGRTIFFLAVWGGIAWFFRQRSIEQDNDGDHKHSHLLARVAPMAMLFFALSVTFFAFDILMSLDAHWFSTIFGVNYFSGGLMAFMAFLAITCAALQGRGFLKNAITKHHYHDLGKLTFAFMVFWTYTAFSQYMLIWYANIPEETGWYLRRQTEGTGWITFSLFYFAAHFFVPFFFLLSRHVKRSSRALSIGAGWVLFVHWIDMYYLVMPQVRPESPLPQPIDIGIFLAMGGLFVAGVVFWLSRASLLARRDPRLIESLAFENV